jgi:hypothetical protein
MYKLQQTEAYEAKSSDIWTVEITLYSILNLLSGSRYDLVS